ncbi:hypothetical protein DACRYDRAFT_22595 [Dacryopinax primogenitus]|uniref:Uncharacterized protein n=1 Tax=Dacryopinax primogenitus (strain DJM 731) TaxID=1858805 RepID=M5FY55_DACPD|nr:uncharacterized protein DACRYDRAFT_22595 [Dacryopinax primogenitus]EJU01469.1 hypothetical protein DACRYDRAFT_22595 [Dacryopinax primogenitus]
MGCRFGAEPVLACGIPLSVSPTVQPETDTRQQVVGVCWRVSLRTWITRCSWRLVQAGQMRLCCASGCGVWGKGARICICLKH